MKKPTSVLLSASLASILLSVLILRALYVPVNPYAMVSLPTDGEQAAEKASEIARSMGVTTQLPPARPALKVRDDLIRTVLRRDGQITGTSLLRRSTEGCVWDVEWKFARGAVQATRDSQSYEVTVGKAAEDSGDIRLQFSPGGSVELFQWHIPDSLDLPQVTEEWARGHATSLFRGLFPALAGMDSFDVHQSNVPHRIVSRCTWASTDTLLRMPVRVEVEFAGDRVLSAEVKYEGVTGGPTSLEEIILSILVGVIIVGLIVVAAILGIKRLRAYELSFALALRIGIVVAIVFGLSAGIQASPRELWMTLLAAVLSGLFVGGMFIILWGVGESLARERWKEKFLSLDLLMRGHAGHSLVGRALVTGTALGVAAPALSLLTTYVTLMLLPHLTLSVDNGMVSVFGLPSPVFGAIFESTRGSVFYVAFGIVALSWLRRWVRKSWILVCLGSLLLVLGGFGKIQAHPIVGLLLIGLPAFLPLAVSLVRVDVLSAIVSLFVSLFAVVVMLFFSGGEPWGATAVVLTVLGFLPLLWGIIALVTADPAVDLDAITPLFARYINERQRLQRELEIARHVQESFLPKHVPEVRGLDVASRCKPALEVGGDYYDFLPLNRGRLGVVIGDVSGKGTEAAFFMTLSKGFLRAIAKTVESPQEVLIRLNDLFCENVQRGEFITMLFAVIDPLNGWVTLARAGHMPALLWQKQAGDVRMILPPGLGLGLEAGPRFAEVIREERIRMEVGDILLLYTDGFTEAMNKSQEEFGEARLKSAMETAPKSEAWAFLDALYRDVREFAGRGNQHDDMTAVVVRKTGVNDAT